MFDCDYEKECEKYLNRELDLQVEPPIIEKPECDPVVCPIFQALELKSFSSYLNSPLYKELNSYLNEQEAENAKTLNKILDKRKTVIK